MSTPTETIAPSADSAPMRVGEHAALDFLNSVLASSGTPLDFLHDGAWLARWLPSAGVVRPDIANAAQRFTPRQLNRLASEARSLREWFRAVVERWRVAGPRGLRTADLEHLNALMSAGALRQALVRGPAGIELQAQAGAAGPSAVLAALAAACADLLAHQPHARVRRCENPSCSLLFADNKRGPQRRWCSMAICGNRMKVAAHRARQRDAH